MLKIGLVGQKGGSGKTVVCQILINAILAKSDASSVLLIDSDPQGSSASYRQAVVARFPDLETRFQCAVCTSEEQFAQTLSDAENIGFDYVIIDSAGSHVELSKSILAGSDKVLVPFRPVLKEFQSQMATVELYEEVKKALNEGGFDAPAFRLMLNNWSSNDRMTVEQKNVFEIIKESNYLADFFVPRRNYFETLDQGYLIVNELETVEVKSNPLLRKNRLEDLEISKQILTSVEEI